MLKAFPVTEENQELIRALSGGGIITHFEGESIYFIVSDDPEVANVFMITSDFLATHAIRGQRTYLVVEKI